MHRVTIKEVTEKFDVEGNLTERVTRTETTEDDNAMESISTDPYTIVPTLSVDRVYSDSTSGTVVAKNATTAKLTMR